MDIFMEHMVQHKRTGKDLLLIFGIIAGGVAALVALSVLTLMFPMVSSIFFMGMVAVVFFASQLIKKTNVEYEYILTNNELDIDKIASRSKRSRVITVNFSNIEICAPATHEQFNKTGRIAKTYDCTGDGEHGIYFIDFADEKGMSRVIFQPPVSYIEKVRRYNPSKIFVD